LRGFSANQPNVRPNMMKSTYPRLHKFLAARLSPEGAAGLHLTIGLILMVAAAWIFGSIAEDVVSADDITRLDVTLANWFHAHASPGLTRFMLLITHWHGVAGVSAMVVLVATYFYRRHARYWLFTLIATVPCGMLLNVLLKYTFQRARPTFDQPLLTLTSYSFPSGHTASATLFYGLLASYLVCTHKGWGVRAAIIVAACAMVALVGLSRMYLGVHFLSDVLAAVAEGCGWLAVCITAGSTLRRRHAARADQ
jgi:membrane-associated phospholipid phosphatase